MGFIIHSISVRPKKLFIRSGTTTELLAPLAIQDVVNPGLTFSLEYCGTPWLLTRTTLSTL